jgi:phosphoribosylanthranilate isomerase
MGITRIKVCCIASCAEAWLAIEHGAAAVGLVSRMPSGPGVIDDATIAACACSVPPGVASFLLTSETSTEAIIEQQRRLRPSVLQLVDDLSEGTHADLRTALPGIGIVQVIHVMDESSINDALRAAPSVDAILLDSGNPKLKVKELGGTGRRHDWAISRRIRDAIAPTPLWLAGGLRAENVAEAIGAVRPFGVDICSGVRTDGRLDRMKLSAFVSAVQGAAHDA